MKWLHLSDLHWGKESEPHKIAASELVNAIDTYSEGSFDVVIITGDIAFSGKEEEYLAFESDFLIPLRKIGTIKDAPILAVPGNHDVDCDIGVNISWDSLSKKRRDNFFNFDAKGISLRKSRDENFRAYAEFLARSGVESFDPREKPADVIEYKHLHSMVFIRINTAYFSDMDETDEHKTPAPTHCLKFLLKDIDREKIVIVMGHHPIEWFMPRTQMPFKSALLEKNAIYIHGHEHQLIPTFEHKGVLSIGFGANYVSPYTADATTYYRNTFTICQLEDELHIAPYSWDLENGKWIQESMLPPSLVTKSSVLNEAYVLEVPFTSGRRGKELQEQRNFNVVKDSVVLSQPIWLSDDSKASWQNILDSLGIIVKPVKSFKEIPSTMGARTYKQFVASDKTGNHLIRTISAVGDILSDKQVEYTNTCLDTESLDSALIVTLGGVSDEAQNLAERLMHTKSITILGWKELNKKITESILRERLENISKQYGNNVVVKPIFLKDGIGLLVSDALKGEWFSLRDCNDLIVPESDEVVFKLRDVHLEYRSAEYHELAPVVGQRDMESSITSRAISFDKDKYKQLSYDIHDDVQYPGLAAIGLQIPNKSLREVYVTTSANTISTDAEQESLSFAVSDAVNSLDLPSDQKEQLHKLLASNRGISTSAEYGAASDLYRIYGNVLVEGDPGSGKSLFVRNEIINYCKPPTKGGSWYLQHVPIFLPLVETPSLLKHNAELLSICAEYARTRKLNIYESDIESLAAQGRVAFFFDGLDEIARIEDRGLIVSKIEKLTNRFAPLGNRFVITSRPAALQTVDIPDQYQRVSLRGLTDEEMRILAEKILATDVKGEIDNPLNNAQNDIVNRLVNDCKEVPGIRRLGRNPLLLTLLVLIYANSGPMVAKRHIVYAQAIRTLVSVRKREVLRELISEADLRRELGLIAMAVYKKEINEIPTRKELHSLLKSSVASGFTNIDDADRKIDEFLNNVSNATGILRFHSRTDDPLDDVLTFMHHSFLEYYAAIRLIKEEFLESFNDIARDVRWREVITLASGIYADRGEVTDVVSALRDAETQSDKITGRILMLALECACEADVPPREAQELIGEWILDYLKIGAGRAIASAREELSKSLANLFETTRSTAIADALALGIKETTPAVSSVTIELIGNMGEICGTDDTIKNAFNDALLSRSNIVRAACIKTLARIPEFRNEASLTLYKEALTRRNAVEVSAVLQAFETNPKLANGYVNEISTLVVEGKDVHSYQAARVIIRSQLYRKDGIVDVSILDRALKAVINKQSIIRSAKLNIVMVHDEIEGWLHDKEISNRVRALRFLALSEDNFGKSFGLLITSARESDDSLIQSEALNSISENKSLAELANLADISFICNCTESQYKNVRISAIKALKQMPAVSDVIDVLINRYLVSGTDGLEKEHIQCIKSMTAHSDDVDVIKDMLYDELGVELRKTTNVWDKKRKGRVRALLSSAEQIGHIAEDKLTTRLLVLMSDYRTPEEIRDDLARAYGRLVRPSKSSAKELAKLLQAKSTISRLALYQAISFFVRRCRVRVKYVRETYSVLSSIQEILVKKWDDDLKRNADRIDIFSMHTIKNCLSDIEQLLWSYRDMT